MKKYLQKNINKEAKELINMQNKLQNYPTENQSINRQLLSILSQHTKINMQKIHTNIIHIPPPDEKKKPIHQLCSKKFNLSIHKNRNPNNSIFTTLQGKQNSHISFQSLSKLKEEIFFTFGTGDNQQSNFNPVKIKSSEISSETTISRIKQDRSPIKRQCSSHSKLRTIHSIKPSPQITPNRKQKQAVTPCRSIKDRKESQQHQSRQKRKFIEVMSVFLTPSKGKQKQQY